MGCSISQAVQNLFVVADSLKDSFLCIYIYYIIIYVYISVHHMFDVGFHLSMAASYVLKLQ